MSYSLEAEQSVLGAMLIDPKNAVPMVIGELSESDFFILDHQKIFLSILGIFNQSKPVDFVTVLESSKVKKDYLLTIAQFVPYVGNVGAYIDIVKSKGQQRRIESKLKDVLFNPDADYLPALEKIIEEERTAPSKNVEEEQTKALIDYSENLYKPLDPSTRIWTGYKEIDNKTGGLLKTGMSCIGAPPSTGKTAIAINIISNQLLKTKNKVVFFSLEMTKGQIFNRLFSSRLSIPFDSIKNKYLDTIQQQKIADEITAIKDTKQFYLFDNIYSFEEMASKIYKIKPDLVVVDYIQRVRVAERINDTRERINFLTQGYKQLAKTNECHVMILSQVAKQADKTGKPKPPKMNDLKESGNIAEDSDYIFMVYRPYVYDKSRDYTPGQAQLLIDKNKDGEAGLVDMFFRGEVQRFEEIEKRYD